jgi:4-amino-4-deoxy-L-arabinose transferase-like glycosyltransferase
LHPSALAKRVYVFTFLIIIAFYLYGLGQLPLLGPDEPRYAQVAREMFLSGDYITPTLGGYTWFEKPSLLYWLIAVSFKVFGVNEWSARFGPALCGLLTIVAVAFVAREIKAGLSSLVVTATCLGLIVFSRAASFDVVVTMTTTWSLAFFLLRELSKRRVYLIGFYSFVGLSRRRRDPVWCGRCLLLIATRVAGKIRLAEFDLGRAAGTRSLDSLVWPSHR